jgi:hypothetical protein
VTRWVIAALALIGLTVSGGAAAAGTPSPSPDPLGASTTTPAGSSVVLAMGHLNRPSNTFWELFLEPAGSASWALHTPPGVASNGGLVLGSSPSGPLTVGFLVSADLKFSPVAQSTDGGDHWLPGELPSPLASAPDALAVGPTGETMAVVAGQRVLQTTGGLSAWTTLTSQGALRSAAPSCGVADVTAVAYNAAAQPLVGVSCTHPGQVGILVPSTSGSWHDLGPTFVSGTASVTRLVRTVDGVAGLAQVQSGKGVTVVGFWGDGSTSQWSGPSSLPVPSGWRVTATATGGGAGQGFAVLLGSGSSRRVEVVAGPGSSWIMLPPAPRGASGVSDVGGVMDTFVVTGSHLAVWTWTAGAAGWRRAASITVPVPYGSSS